MPTTRAPPPSSPREQPANLQPPPPHSLLSGHSLALGLEAMLVCHDAQELLLVDLAVAIDVGLVRLGLR